MTIARFAFAAAVLATASAGALAHDGAEKITGPADSYVYELAAPGTYRLPVIKPAASAAVLDDKGGRHELSDLFEGHLTILAFIYTRCGDVCPLATMYMSKLRDMAAHHGKGKLRLITLSFDPDHDTPEKMAEYARPWRDDDEAPALPWLFLTAPSRAAIAPLLRAYNQPIAPKADSDNGLSQINHLMRVFLIDEKRRIRNIYSPEFLDPRLLLNDVLTLAGTAQG